MLPVLDTIKDHLASLPEVERIVLYGSRARGDNGPRSDIDLAVECSDAGEAPWSEIWAYLEYDAPTLLSIDLTRLNKAPEELRKRIERDGITLYER